MLKVLYFITLGLIAVAAILSIVWGFMFTNRIGGVWLVVTLFLTGLVFFWNRMLFELAATALRVSDNTEKDAGTV
jgi:hypothetical protein